MTARYVAIHSHSITVATAAPKPLLLCRRWRRRTARTPSCCVTIPCCCRPRPRPERAKACDAELPGIVPSSVERGGWIEGGGVRVDGLKIPSHAGAPQRSPRTGCAGVSSVCARVRCVLCVRCVCVVCGCARAETLEPSAGLKSMRGRYSKALLTRIDGYDRPWRHSSTRYDDSRASPGVETFGFTEHPWMRYARTTMIDLFIGVFQCVNKGTVSALQTSPPACSQTAGYTKVRLPPFLIIICSHLGVGHRGFFCF